MKLYNTLSRRIEDFEPLNGNKVNMFACGPTVYDFAHIGNGRTAITMDVLSRLLRYLNYDVFYLVNITDIDDKIINRASEQGVSWEELRDKYEAQYFKDTSRLGIKIDKYARATNYIDDIIKQVNTLLEKGNAYKIDDGIYFEISSFPDYGKLSRRKDTEKDDAQSRIDQNDNKRGWNDFCLWKFSKTGEPVWDANFGAGRPGWHIEDTAITEHFFGPQYDIHGGGSDLIFPHHEAEITQMEASSGIVPFVKYWVHGGLLYIDNARMGKSNKNFYTIDEVLNKYSSDAIRLFMLQGHYRSTLNFSFELLDGAVNRLARWQKMADLRWQLLNNSITESISQESNNFINCLKNDIDTPGAIAEAEKIFELVEAHGVSDSNVKDFDAFLEAVESIFGINLLQDDISDDIKELINKRNQARIDNDWNLSDKLREEILEKGILLNDNTNRTTWSRA
jgi:cysteinyl-tRNA synthetase